MVQVTEGRISIKQTESSIKTPGVVSKPVENFFSKAASTIAKMDRVADAKSVNLFNNDDLNKDYSNAKDAETKNLFVQKLALLDAFGGEHPDNKIDGKIGGQQDLLAVKDEKQKKDLIQLLLQALGLNKDQNDNQQIELLIVGSNIPSDLSVIIPLPALGSSMMKQRDYSPEKIKELNKEGIYTSASEMMPKMVNNITNGKIKNVQAGTFGGVKLNGDQVNNANIIAATVVDVGKKKNQSAAEINKAVVVALATAMQESTLKNIGYGDINQKTGKMTTSRGLFQQIKAWGSEEERMNPVSATTMFAEKLYKTDYMNKSVTNAAQSVQKSGFPEAYAKWQQMAEALTTAMLS